MAQKSSGNRNQQDHEQLDIQKLQEQLAQREAELAVINSIQTALASQMDFQGIIDTVGDKLSEIFKDGNVGIGFLNEVRNVVAFPYVVENGKRLDYFEISLDVPSVLVHSINRRRPFVINKNISKRFGTDVFNVPGLDQHELKAWLSVPLISGDKLLGGIALRNWQRENAYAESDVRLLQTIANSMSVALENVSHFEETQRLLKETKQRATELQIINNIGQTLTEGLDLNSILERVGERLREALQLKSVGIIANDSQTSLAITHYLYHYGKRVIPEGFSLNRNRLAMRFALKMGGKPLVVNTNAEKYWRKIVGDMLEWPEIPQSFVIVPLLADRQLVGSITIGDYEEENAFLDLPINLLETIASNIGTAIQSAHLFDATQRLLKETEQRATELQIINNIGQTLTEGLDLQSTLERVGDRLRDVLKPERIGITVFDEKIEHIFAHYGYRNGKRDSGETLSLSQIRASMRLSARGGGRSWVVNRDAEKSWRIFGGVNEDEIPKSFAKLPLHAGGKVVGGITLGDYTKEDAFTDISIGMLETIASNIGTAIHNVRLFDETQRLLKETEQRATELQIINNIGQTLTEGGDLSSMIQRVGERIQETLHVKDIIISVFDEKTGRVLAPYMVRNGNHVTITEENFDLKTYKFMLRASTRAGGRSWVWVVNTDAERGWRRSFILNDDVPKSFVTLPLLAGRQVIGGITIADFERENAFSDISVSLLETIASNMGTAVQNVRLFEETQRLLKETAQRATELQIINNIGQTLTEGGDLEIIIQRVGERIQQALNINNIAISILDKETEHLIASYMVRNGEQFTFRDENFDLRRYKMMMRASARAGGISWVVKDVEKVWRKSWRGPIADDVPKSMVVLPLLAGGEIIGGISLADYEKENAFTDLSVNLLETIASNMGTAVQNVRLFEETQRLFKEAEESRAAAEQANKAKSTFLANMSHELRTPLNAIIGFTRIVKRKAEGALPEKQIENLDKVLISSDHLLNLINTVLDIAKIEAGRMDVVPAKFSLNTLADQCATLAIPLLKPDVTLEKQVDETIGFMFSDQDKIKQIVLNLLSNAAKFTHEGKILLSVQKVSDADVSISVADNGIGISEEALGRVFEEFQQADNTTTRQYGGTGLGLTISRNLARLLGGDLTATSKLGKGSTFTLTLPLQYGKRPASPSDSELDTAQATESQDNNISARENFNKPSLKTILIVEDTELNIDVLTQLLDDNYHLLIAKDGAQGVSMAQQNNPDLILMDISLPIIDGYEATRRIREAQIFVPIIGLSAHAMSGDTEKAKEAGCNEYMTKPIDEALLIKKLNQYLR